jgi:hypothetical protein
MCRVLKKQWTWEVGGHRLVINPRDAYGPTMLLHHAEELDAVAISHVLDYGTANSHDLRTRPDEDLALASLLGIVLML